MGYRLEIYDENDTYLCCGEKFFGYPLKDEEDLENTTSYNWLLMRGYIDEDTIFDYEFTNLVILIGSEINEFMCLYLLDYLKYGWGSQYIATGIITKVLLNKERHKLYLRWGG